MAVLRRTILGVHIHDITPAEAEVEAERLIEEPHFHQVVTPGPEFILEAGDNKEFHRILNQADLSLPDGMGLKIAGLLTGQKFRSRVTGVDFVFSLLKLAEQKGYRVFLYGGQPGVVDTAAKKIARQFPKISIVGTESGFRGHWQKVPDYRIVEKIHLAKPHILLVALGAPKQELWIERHRHALHDVRLAMGVGRTFDYLAGQVKRPPKLVRQLGMEWLMTFMMAGKLYQPHLRRQRIRNATFHFMWKVVTSRHV